MLLEAGFPKLLFLFAAPKVVPAAVLFAAEFDFTNFDSDPISVRLLNPWTGEVLRMSQLPSTLPRIVSTESGTTGTATDTNKVVPPFQFAFLAQAWTPPNDVPFLCIRGVREYHRHPAHTGDSWFLYRGRGEGALLTLISQILAHGPNVIQGYGIQIQFKGLVPTPNASIEQIVTRVNGLAHVFGEKFIVTPF